ncbi:hypothetical protein RB11340 [Rhodopirellula baltica SH 1]|uniref:Orc1-like AAA ATPase domain-containing protein n=1 Tax=Rhodopirellula baltica (strain DSM 10527 / NCIMB 13988 / SH1) TaxID=243090 RepID=Q7UEG8_RHOBA|nr:hypothetical protein RB11340 [Rhodopirellula baltica SH 1]
MGRDWVLRQLESWWGDPSRQDRMFLLQGGPGVGKSAFAVHLAHFGRDKVVAASFYWYDKVAYPIRRHAL